MEQTDFERLKQICEKEGFELLNESENDNGKFFVITKPKDIWEGVEFVIPNHNSTASKVPYKVVSIENGFVKVYCPYSGHGLVSQIQKSELSPSTQSAYVDQLKAEAFRRFGEIKEGDRFDRNWISAPFNISKIGDIKNALGTGFFYSKKNDELFFDSINIYRQGKWATRAPERIKVHLYDCKTKKVNDNLSFLKCSFEITEKSMTHNTYDIGSFLSEKLEKFLNNE